MMMTNEDHDNDNHISINDLNTIEQMNTAQINTKPETSDKITHTGESWRPMSKHGYVQSNRILNTP